MLALTVRSLWAHRMRTALTAAAVVLGVGLVSGTLILTDTINRTFDNVFSQATSGFQVAIQTRQVIKQEFQEPPPMPERLLARVRGVPGVRAAVGTVFSEGIVYDRRGKRLSTSAPNFIASTAPKPFDPFDYVQGRPPRADGEVALDRDAAKKAGYRLGDLVSVSGAGPRRRFRLVGIAKFGQLGSFAGASAAIFTLPEAQRMAGKVGELDEIDVLAEPGVSPAQLRARIAGALPRTVVVRTSRQQAQEQANTIKEGFSFINVALLVFAGIALFVGAFIIFNSFSMTVAQRMREFALLRTLGASRRQILRTVVGEATLVGLAASALGVLAGFVLAPALIELFKAFGADLPAEGTVFQAKTAVVGLALGTTVTVVASLAPALRATRVAPVLALHEGAILPGGRGRRWRTPIALGIGALGVGVIAYGLLADLGSGGSVAGLLGAGAVAVFVSVAMMSAVLVRPLASVVGWPLERLRGVTGRLARENALRNPGRTASTAAALMVGLALVTFVAIFAAGTRGSVDKAIDESFDAQIVLQSTSGFGPIPAAVEPAAARVPGVAVAAPLKFSVSKVRGVNGEASAAGVDTGRGRGAFRVQWIHGSPATLAGLGRNDTVVDDTWATDNGVKVPGTLSVTTPTAKHLALRIRGSYKDSLNFGRDYIVPAPTLVAQYGVKEDRFVLIQLAPGAREPDVRRALDRMLKRDFPQVEALTIQGFKDKQAAQLNQVLGLIYVLLALSVVVALFGIVNTLALSIHERTRELGMLRAIGTSRAQVRQMVRYESVITALIGAVLGSVLGVFFAVVISRPLESDGFSLSFPVGTLALLLVLAALAGVLAAIGPARRASRLDVLEALAYE
jgi:putative ABC transport system permease protein